MIVLGQVNFSEEQRLFGYWKKINKALKKKELLREFDKSAGCDTSSLPPSRRIEAAREIKSGMDYVSTNGIGTRNLNQLINDNAISYERSGPNGDKLEHLRDAFGNGSSSNRSYLKRKKIAEALSDKTILDRVHREYDHPNWPVRHGDLMIAAKKENLLNYKNYREELKDQFEQKLKKDLKRDNLSLKLGLGAIGAAGLGYGGYKLYQKYKNNKEKDNKKED